MNFSRSMILVVGTALLAACGDKVTVTQYTPPATVAKVYGVEVAPATATLTTGASLTFTAAVNADAGVATSVTWSASAGTITTAGVFTAPTTANAGIAVCATSTVDTGKKGCATVVVQAAAAVIPATVSINSIQVTGAVGGATVNPAAVAGGIDVTLNVNPGNQTVSKIVLIVGGIRQDSQVFSAAQSAALRYAADQAVAEQSTFPQVVFSVNTAAFNATTGAPRWLNGSQGVSAQLYAGGSSAAATATAQTNLTFANVDGFAISYTMPSTGAVDATGYRWYGNGSLTVNALPVMYSGSSIGTVSAALSANPAAGSTCFAAVGNIGSATTKTGNVYVIAGTMAALQSGFGCTTTFPNVVTIAATNANGDNLTLAGTATTPAGVIGTQLGVRWDNVAPAQPTANFTMATGVGPNGRQSWWFNDAVALTGKATSSTTGTAGATSNSLVCDNNNPAVVGLCAGGVTAPVDAGVGGTAFEFHAAATTSVTTASAAASIATTSGLDRAATRSTYCGVLQSVDALGNKSAAISSGSTSNTCSTQMAAAGNKTIFTFGVDRDIPVPSFNAGGLAANARVSGASITTNFIIDNTDGVVGTTGVSGMNNATPCYMLVSQRTASATNTLDAAGAATTSTVPISTGVSNTIPANGQCSTSGGFAALATAGYYTLTYYVVDDAGNPSASISRTIVYDNTAATVTAASVPASISGSFAASAFASDNLDLRDYYWTVRYNGGALAYLTPVTMTLASAATAINAFNPTTLINTNFAMNQTVSMPLFLQATTGANAPVAYAAAAANALTDVFVFGRDQTQAAYSGGTTAIPFASITAPTSGVSLTNFTTFTPATSAATLCALAAATGGCTVGAGNAASATWSVAAAGVTAVFNNPFSRVDFYASNGTDLVLVGSTSAPTLADNGAVRTWTWSLPVTASTLFGQLGGVAGGAPGATIARNVFALGYNSTGLVAMVSQPIVQTINP